jgi:hypothetical protein
MFVRGSVTEVRNKEEQDGEAYILKRNFIICTIHIMLFVWLDQEGRNRGKINYAFIKIHFGRKSSKERMNMET